MDAHLDCASSFHDDSRSRVVLRRFGEISQRALDIHAMLCANVHHESALDGLRLQPQLHGW